MAGCRVQSPRLYFTMDSGTALIISAAVPTLAIWADRWFTNRAARKKAIEDSEAREATAQHNREIAVAVKDALDKAAKDVKQEVVHRADVIKDAVDTVNGSAAELRREVADLRADVDDLKSRKN